MNIRSVQEQEHWDHVAALKACSCHFLTNQHGYVGLLHLETSAVHPLWCCDHFGAKLKLCTIWATVNDILSNPDKHEWVSREKFSEMK